MGCHHFAVVDSRPLSGIICVTGILSDVGCRTLCLDFHSQFHQLQIVFSMLSFTIFMSMLLLQYELFSTFQYFSRE